MCKWSIQMVHCEEQHLGSFPQIKTGAVFIGNYISLPTLADPEPHTTPALPPNNIWWIGHATGGCAATVIAGMSYNEYYRQWSRTHLGWVTNDTRNVQSHIRTHEKSVLKRHTSLYGIWSTCMSNDVSVHLHEETLCLWLLNDMVIRNPCWRMKTGKCYAHEHRWAKWYKAQWWKGIGDGPWR